MYEILCSFFVSNGGGEMQKEFLCKKVAKMIICLGYLTRWRLEEIYFARSFSEVSLYWYLKTEFKTDELLEMLDFLIDELDEIPVTPI